MSKRNCQGGNKYKSMARKDMVKQHDNRLVVSSDPLEIYAMVTKLLGNGMFYAEDQDKNVFLGHIRNKFRGKSKRQNMVGNGSIILLGLREWERPHKNGDLIHIYEQHDIEALHLNFNNSSANPVDADMMFDYGNIDVSAEVTAASTGEKNTIESLLKDVDFDDI